MFVGLSGGVDSGVSVVLLQKAGFEVTGVFIKIQIEGYPCPASADRIEAMRVAAHLRIPFREIDLSSAYKQEVLKLSLKEFEQGRTPNPDALCNREIKFGKFFEYARAQGADFVATGHYAQTKNGLLFAGADKEKDQSYFLWAVSEAVLKHTLFPVGRLHKPRVRALAKKFSLPNARRPDSQGLCFLGDIGLHDLLKKEVAHTPGDVLSENGEVIGSHEGVPFYTLGQRHGFTLFSLRQVGSVDIKPQYVITKDIEKNTITVSSEKFPMDARATQVELADTNWIGDISDGPVLARYRYRQTLIQAQLTRAEGRAIVVLTEPHYAPVGQSMVLYVPTQSGYTKRCLGGGVIKDVKVIR